MVTNGSMVRVDLVVTDTSLDSSVRNRKIMIDYPLIMQASPNMFYLVTVPRKLNGVRLLLGLTNCTLLSLLLSRENQISRMETMVLEWSICWR